MSESDTRPQVLNARFHKINRETDVFIGRPSKWGNPFAITKVCTRDEAIAKHKAHLAKHPELVEAAKRELRGKNLVCYCAPCACHGDTWMEIANA